MYHYDPLNQEGAKGWKKSDEEIAARLRRTSPTEKIIMVIFWDDIWYSSKQNIFWMELRSAVPSYASMIDRLRCTIVEKGGGNVAVVVDSNAPVDKCNFVHTAIGKSGFVELNDPAYSER